MTGFLNYCSCTEPTVIGFQVPLHTCPNNPQTRLTNKANIMLARALLDNTTFHIRRFSVGCGGFQEYEPTRIKSINPLMPFLENEIYCGDIAYINYDVSTCVTYYCRIPRGEATACLGELGLWAKIMSSPFPFEIGTEFLFAVQHFPMCAKARDDIETFKIQLSFH